MKIVNGDGDAEGGEVVVGGSFSLGQEMGMGMSWEVVIISWGKGLFEKIGGEIRVCGGNIKFALCGYRKMNRYKQGYSNCVVN